MAENEIEIWRALPGVTGVEVSTLGKVRTLDKVVSNGKGTYLKKGRVLKQRYGKDGYLRVNINVGGKKATKRVHQLVAQIFIPNPNNLPQINHKDCDKTNNNASNLEFCTAAYNIQYREKFGEALGHPLFAVNLVTLEVSSFRSQHEASRKLGVYHGSISKVINGRHKRARGFWFVNADKNAVDIVKQKLHDIGKTGLKLNA